MAGGQGRGGAAVKVFRCHGELPALATFPNPSTAAPLLPSTSGGGEGPRAAVIPSNNLILGVERVGGSRLQPGVMG